MLPCPSWKGAWGPMRGVTGKPPTTRGKCRSKQTWTGSGSGLKREMEIAGVASYTGKNKVVFLPKQNNGMLPPNDRLDYLFDRYLDNRIDDNELAELFGYIRDAHENDLLKRQIIDVFREIKPEVEINQVNWEAMFSDIINNPAFHARRRTMAPGSWWKAAAVWLILLGGGAGYMWMSHRAAPQKVVQADEPARDILPGQSRATLTLSNGTAIVLDSTDNGKLAGLAATNGMKVNSGLLTYIQRISANHGSGTEPVVYNTLTTSRGGQYRLTLADGTKVWLNAASSIRYPVAFTGKERVVQITGEVYFEVAENAAQPFIVRISPSASGGGGEIRVLGTHFNVNAYDDENTIKVALLEGSIKVQTVNGARDAAVIHPGQQAQMNKQGVIEVQPADVDDVVSWKDGLFSFRNSNLQEVMQKLSRWYDVEVVYQPGLNNKQQFTGKIDRNLTLSEVLRELALTHAHFRIEADRKVVLLP